MLGRTGRYTGPVACIDDHIERKYFDNATVSGVSILIIELVHSACMLQTSTIIVAYRSERQYMWLH